jgi:hypothetical protein
VGTPITLLLGKSSLWYTRVRPLSACWSERVGRSYRTEAAASNARALIDVARSRAIRNRTRHLREPAGTRCRLIHRMFEGRSIHPERDDTSRRRAAIGGSGISIWSTSFSRWTGASEVHRSREAREQLTLLGLASESRTDAECGRRATSQARRDEREVHEKRPGQGALERKTGFEPATSSLARRCSTS